MNQLTFRVHLKELRILHRRQLKAWYTFLIHSSTNWFYPWMSLGNTVVRKPNHLLLVTTSNSMSSCNSEFLDPRPLLLFSVVGTDGKMLRDEGYAAKSLPSAPGNYLFNLHTWKPAARSISDKMKDLFLGISPSIQDPKTILTGSDSQVREFYNKLTFGWSSV